MRFGKQIEVLILIPRLDDRTALCKMLRADSNFHVSAICLDPFQAKDQLLREKVDILILAMELPRMSGLQFLASLRGQGCDKAIIISSCLKDDPDLAIRARKMGVALVLERPPEGLASVMPQILESLLKESSSPVVSGANRAPSRNASRRQELIAIGASTGGTEALRLIIKGLQRWLPPIVIVQHMPKHFTGLFANSLNDLSELEVVEFSERQLCQANTVYVAAGGQHMVVRRYGGELYLDVDESLPPMIHKPSVDVLFRSVAEVAGTSALGVLLTGMGSDGAKGLLAMREKGALTIGQDEASSVVYGMPKEAAQLGAVAQVLALTEIGPALQKWGAS